MKPTLTSWRSLLALLTTAFPACVIANVEKVIFLGPEPANIPLAKPSLPDLHIHTLTPESSSVRTNLTRIFPDSSPNGASGYSTWALLDELAEGQRYEVRVCWAAIEPTSFILDVYDLDTVWKTPELIQSLAEYATSRQQDPGPDALGPQLHQPRPEDSRERKASVMLLRVQAAADYFTDDKSLMTDPHPVLVDLILDPYVFNAVPHSLLPTIGYLLLVAALTWFASSYVKSTLLTIAGNEDDQSKKRD